MNNRKKKNKIKLLLVAVLSMLSILCFSLMGCDTGKKNEYNQHYTLEDLLIDLEGEIPEYCTIETINLDDGNTRPCLGIEVSNKSNPKAYKKSLNTVKKVNKALHFPTCINELIEKVDFMAYDLFMHVRDIDFNFISMVTWGKDETGNITIIYTFDWLE